MTEENVAVLIDYENVGLDSMQDLMDQLSDVGRLIVKRAYADWSVQRSKRDQLLELGVEAVHHFRSNKSGKNSSDICLAIDAVDLMYGAPVDTFVIVSSDSDFVPLVSKLRAAGKKVIGSGRRGVTSPTLVKSCDRYIYLSEVRPANPTRRRQTVAKETDPNSLVVRAMEASMDDQGQVVGSKLHNNMQRIDPSFSFKALGFRTFRQFLASCKEVKFTQPEDASDVVVQLAYARERGHNLGNGSAGSDGQDRREEPRETREDRGRQPPQDQRRHQDQRRDRQPHQEQPAAPQPVLAAAVDQPKDEEEVSPTASGDWEKAIHDTWSGRGREIVFGPVAAADAAKALGVSKLSASEFPSLDALLDASPLLKSKWRRERNTVRKI